MIVDIIELLSYLCSLYAICVIGRNFIYLTDETQRQQRYNYSHLKQEVSTGWPKSNVPKVRAYCSASDHLIRKIFSGVCRDIHWFEEYLNIIEIDDHFFE